MIVRPVLVEIHTGAAGSAAPNAVTDSKEINETRPQGRTKWTADGAAHLVFFPKPQQLRAYSAGTIWVAGRSSSRRSTGRRMLAIKRRSSLWTALGLRKCEANSRLISTGRQ